MNNPKTLNEFSIQTMNEVRLKFQPIWITIISLMTLSFLYRFYIITVNHEALDATFLVRALFICLISWLILPLIFKMLTGVPAILLTQDGLVDNLGNHYIKWEDILEIKLIESNYKSFDKLVINLKQPEKYFDTMVKKLRYKFRQLFIANDVGIFLDFVAGNNGENAQLIQSFWTKYADKSFKTPHAP